MEHPTLMALIQAIFIISSTLAGCWIMFSKKNDELQEKLGARIMSLEHQVRLSNGLRKQDQSGITSNDYKNRV